MHINIDHNTKYSFTQPIKKLVQLLKITPKSNINQSIINWSINIDCDAGLKSFNDEYGNICHMLTIDQPINTFTIEIIGNAETFPNVGIGDKAEEILHPSIFLRSSQYADFNNDILDYANKCIGKDTLSTLHNLKDKLSEDLQFTIGETSVATKASEVLTIKKGVCQDYAHLFIASARSLKIPARYVSGHLLRDDGMNFQEAAHAWAESYIEGLGWVGFDPSNGVCPNESYLKIAHGLDYNDAAPISGVRTGGGEELLSVNLFVRGQNQ